MPEAAETETSSSPFGSEGRRVFSVLAAVVAHATLITALAYYFGYRRERAFAGYFGVDVSALGFSTSDYVLRSVDAFFVPVSVVLLVAFGAAFAHALAGDRLDRVDITPLAALAGFGAIAVGVALLVGKPLANEYSYLQALGPAVGVALLVYVLAHRRSVSRHATSAAAFVGVAVILVSFFWATAEYADSRGRTEAQQLARDIVVDPSVTIFSKENLSIQPKAPGGGVSQSATHVGCTPITVKKLHKGAYRFVYSGFTLLIRSGGNYFLTPTPVDPPYSWRPRLDSVFVIPDNSKIRVELTRGADYIVHPVEQTANGILAFTC